jgi:hypothetical protein
MFRRRRQINVPPPPEVEKLEHADEVLREHRSTIIRVKNILEAEVRRIDKYLEGSA